MATIQEIKTKLLNVNALGRTNLAEKGVELPETATTYEIMGKIAEIVGSSGSGTEYTSIVYNTDNTITLTDKDGAVHTMSCTYEDGKLIGVTYDGKAVDLTYNGDVLVKVGNTAVDMGNAPNEPTINFNITYGETAPEDTSKLWVKANEPTNIKIDSELDIIESVKTNNTHLSTACYSIGCARVGTKIYLFGGGIFFDSLNTINVFDIETETITALTTTLPTAYYNMGCAAVGNKIYLFGGYSIGGNVLNTINVFDIETETIRTLSATLPTVCYGLGCASVGTKIYLFGGYRSGGNVLNTINVFDIETETITTLSTTLPTDCGGLGCASISNKIYLFGGYSSGYLNTINVFDIETETITTLSTTLPTNRSSMGCSSIGNKIYLFGGYSSGHLNTINVFDIETETSTILTTTLPTDCSNMGCASVGTKIYLFGGESSSGYLNTINVFTLTHALSQGNIAIQSGLLKNKFNLINTDTAQVEIGVENVYIGNENNEAELCEAYLHNGTEWVMIE